MKQENDLRILFYRHAYFDTLGMAHNVMINEVGGDTDRIIITVVRQSL